MSDKTATQGKRVYCDEGGALYLEPGDYGFVPAPKGYKGGVWMARPPKGDAGTLSNHQVTEHDNGAISVNPSIQSDSWHGYLERGIWLEL